MIHRIYSKERINDKIEELMDIEAIDDERMMHLAMSSIVPGICMNPTCDYTTDVEPDAEEGWCELCNTRTVASILRLEGIV